LPVYPGLMITNVTNARWLLPIRLLAYVLISGIVFFRINFPNFLSFPFFAYSLLTLLLPALLVARRWLHISFVLKSTAYVQSVFEILVILGIVYVTGNINSSYSGLLILCIISTALVSRLVGTLSIASLVSCGYAFIVWFGLGLGGDEGSATRALETIFSSQDAAFYSIFLHILTFFLVAFVAGYLVEHLQRADRQLADTSQALRRARLETDDILRHLNSGLLTIEPEGRIIFFNRAAEEILDASEIDVKGHDFRRAFSDRMASLSDVLEEVLQSRKHSRRSEVDIRKRDGTVVPIGLSTSILVDEDGSVRGLIAIFQDLTETKILEDKIRTADRMAAVGELSAAIAHEIRNPLAAISGSVEVLQAELDLADENNRLLELIIKESSRLNQILADFLLYARSKRSAFNRVELCRLVSDVMEMVRHLPAYHEGIALRLLAEEPVVYVFGDEDQIKQILINLVVNAMEAIENTPGEIIITIEGDDALEIPVVVLKVTDSGPGIPEDIRDKIFDPFFSTKRDGTGLGLGIVQRLAESMGLDLYVHTRERAGTSFILTFSRLPQSVSSSESMSEAASTDQTVTPVRS
ncbi:MAG: PAS domain-containing protein, partial [candidate division Zixibacteria bacterium]|nr:PAS domain-containing protein [candidate division Zixibacteria bacterium]